MTWSSTKLGDVSTVNTMDPSISVYTTNFTDADGDTFILSVLELCDFGDSYAANYTCTATNRVGGTSVGPASVTVSISAGTYIYYCRLLCSLEFPGFHTLVRGGSLGLYSLILLWKQADLVGGTWLAT